MRHDSRFLTFNYCVHFDIDPFINMINSHIQYGRYFHL